MIRPVLVALAACIVAAAFVLHAPSSPGPAVRDFEAYYGAGAAWHYGGDPYSRDVWRAEKAVPGVVATRDELLPFVGPPFGLPLWSALSRLPWRVAAPLWQAVLIVAIMALALGSLRLAGGSIAPLDVVAVGLFAVGFGPLTSAFALGQVALVAVAAIVLTALALKRSVALALPTALVAALQPNLAVVLITRLGAARAWIALGGAALIAFLGAALALGGMAGVAHYLNVLGAQQSAERFIAIQMTPSAIARALGASAPTAGWVALACAFVVVAGIAAQWRSRRYASDMRLALACAALPLALPFAHEHDLCIAFLPAIVAARRARGPLWALIAAAALFAGTDWLGLAQRPAGAAQTLLLTLAAGLALAALAREPLRAYHALPLLVAFVILGASLVAAAHPLPTWPDMLPPNFHVSPTLAAAQVWHLEQVRSGIARLEPAWGWLRLASLGGCALLWLTASLALGESAHGDSAFGHHETRRRASSSRTTDLTRSSTGTAPNTAARSASLMSV